MCVIVYKPAGKTLSKDTLEKCYRANPDGIGIMRFADGEIKQWQGLGTDGIDQLLDEIVPTLGDAEYALHFRWATTGSVKVDNCHPFPSATHGGLLMHNGVLNGAKGLTIVGDETDTAAYIRQYFDTTKDPLGKEGLPELGNNKLLWLDPTGQFWFYNYKDWVLHSDGCTYSNLRWQYAPAKATKTYYSGSQQQNLFPNNTTKDKPKSEIVPSDLAYDLHNALLEAAAYESLPQGHIDALGSDGLLYHINAILLGADKALADKPKDPPPKIDPAKGTDSDDWPPVCYWHLYSVGLEHVAPLSYDDLAEECLKIGSYSRDQLDVLRAYTADRFGSDKIPTIDDDLTEDDLLAMGLDHLTLMTYAELMLEAEYLCRTQTSSGLRQADVVLAWADQVEKATKTDSCLCDQVDDWIAQAVTA